MIPRGVLAAVLAAVLVSGGCAAHHDELLLKAIEDELSTADCINSIDVAGVQAAAVLHYRSALERLKSLRIDERTEALRHRAEKGLEDAQRPHGFELDERDPDRY